MLLACYKNPKNKPMRKIIQTKEPSQTYPNKRTAREEKQPYRRTNRKRGNQLEESQG